MLNDKLVLYVHGKGGEVDEAEHYKPFFLGCDVIGLDYKAETPWQAKEELTTVAENLFKNYKSVILIANSIGAYFSMCALPKEKIETAFFISPIVDMKKLIENMMALANVTESELFEKKEIKTDSGEILFWDYLCYVREHSFEWNIPTHILYGEKDNLISLEELSKFASKIKASITVMPNGEHWFHTAEQMEFLDNWIKNNAINE